jgi:alanine dehydrogenase
MYESKSVSILKETRDGDKRVVILPDGVRKFVDAGFWAYVEHHAGIGLGISDNDYEAAGAKIVSTEEAWRCSPYVVKYKYPSKAEYQYLQPNMHLCCYLYAGGNELLTNTLCELNITSYAYEFFETADGHFPLMTSDSEISGHMAVIYGAYHLLESMGGRGVLLCHVPDAKRAKVVVIGYGNAGGAAARTAAAMGAQVVVLGTNPVKLRKFQATMPPNVTCYVNTPEVREREFLDADLVVGAILISTYDTPPMINRELLMKMKVGAVIVDVTCGYGEGFLPTGHTQTRDLSKIYEVEGVLHIKNDIMPASVPFTSAEATSKNHTAYLINLGRTIFENDFSDPISEAAKVTQNGKIVHPEIIKDFQLIIKSRIN